MDSPQVDPINPQQTDAAAGSVFTGERRGYTSWAPHMPGSNWTRLEAVIAILPFVGIALVIALWAL